MAKRLGYRANLPEPVHFGPVPAWGELADNEIIEDIDELAKDNIHERKDGARYYHANEGDTIHNPALGVVVGEYSLDWPLASGFRRECLQVLCLYKRQFLRYVVCRDSRAPDVQRDVSCSSHRVLLAPCSQCCYCLSHLGQYQQGSPFRVHRDHLGLHPVHIPGVETLAQYPMPTSTGASWIPAPWPNALMRCNGRVGGR